MTDIIANSFANHEEYYQFYAEYMNSEEMQQEEYWFEFPSEMGLSKYLISTEGKIYSKATNKVRAQHINCNGYVMMPMTYDSGEISGGLMHILVADTFIPNSGNKLTVDHIDRDPTNNKLNNVRHATIKEQRANQRAVNTRKGKTVVYTNLITMIQEEYPTIKSVSDKFKIPPRKLSLALNYEGGYVTEDYTIELKDFSDREWRDVVGIPKFEGLGLQVSSDGFVKTRNGYITNGSSASDGGEKYFIFNAEAVHVMVCLAFVGPKPISNITWFVNHIDHNKRNNVATNLEWVTAAENSKKYFEHKYNPEVDGVSKYDLRGKYLEDYISAKRAADSVGTHRLKIEAVLDTKLSAYGFLWRRTPEVLIIHDDGSYSIKEQLDDVIPELFHRVYMFEPNNLIPVDVFPDMSNQTYKANPQLAGINRPCILKCLHGLIETAGNFIWKQLQVDCDGNMLEKLTPKDVDPFILKIRRIGYIEYVCQFEIGNPVPIRYFESYADAQLFMGVKNPMISKCCNRECDTAFGFVWRRIRHNEDGLPIEEIDISPTETKIPKKIASTTLKKGLMAQTKLFGFNITNLAIYVKYDDIKHAVRENEEYLHDCIKRVINGKSGSYKRLYWKFLRVDRNGLADFEKDKQAQDDLFTEIRKVSPYKPIEIGQMKVYQLNSDRKFIKEYDSYMQIAQIYGFSEITTLRWVQMGLKKLHKNCYWISVDPYNPPNIDISHPEPFNFRALNNAIEKRKFTNSKVYHYSATGELIHSYQNLGEALAVFPVARFTLVKYCLNGINNPMTDGSYYSFDLVE